MFPAGAVVGANLGSLERGAAVDRWNARSQKGVMVNGRAGQSEHTRRGHDQWCHARSTVSGLSRRCRLRFVSRRPRRGGRAEKPARRGTAGVPGLTILAPAAPGGGWDQLAREMQRVIEEQALVAMVQVENVPGAAGTIGLAQLINGRRGDGRALLVNGLVMLGAILWNQSPVSITQVTPIARLTGEYEIVAVPATSSHRDMQSLVRALRKNPAAVSWGGGSAGGTDHILAGLIVAAAGVDPRRTNYIAFSGGGEAVTALIGEQVTAGISGYSEFAQHIESGRLRAIGISAPRRLAHLDVPSLIEQGLDVELENWRAVVAPPGLNEARRTGADGCCRADGA
jgi:putative tricarboxylic transport membrane protein